MKKRLLCLLQSIVFCLCLTGCGSLYDKEYVSISHYTIQPETEASKEEITVSNLNELSSAIRSLVSEGKTSGRIIFTEDYQGEPSEDLAAACWAVRTHDALCAYCVDNISYDLSKIVSYMKADILVSYSDRGVRFSDILKLPYAVGVDKIIEQAVSDGTAKLAILINSSTMSANDIEELALNVYKTNPLISPCTPKVHASLFNGSNLQKLYEIIFSYILDKEELDQRREVLNSFEPFSKDDLTLTDLEKAALVFEYFTDCEYNPEKTSIYEALIEKSADSEGYSLACVALCNKLGLESKIVEGQLNYTAHSWNLVKINGYYYHFDASSYIQNKTAQSVEELLMNDSQAWGIYRWDTSAYPGCSGTLE